MDFPGDSLLGALDHLQLYNDSLHNNFSGGYNDTDAFLPTGVKATIVMVYMVVCVVGLVGNCLVMYVIIRHVLLNNQAVDSSGQMSQTGQLDDRRAKIQRQTGQLDDRRAKIQRQTGQLDDPGRSRRQAS
ncbi:hypothetical protein NHX12_012967 [Muraenolepis orangiensis]|uniref:Uncharacterized protein n=1 Tax=Muraenolepis orangiensis TaxID=630683 RepID=A0A9Q0I5Y5_9TELE|nr:hypothetical protein NHX12_012967 [Muraenolepis orangiensis]